MRIRIAATHPALTTLTRAHSQTHTPQKCSATKSHTPIHLPTQTVTRARGILSHTHPKFTHTLNPKRIRHKKSLRKLDDRSWCSPSTKTCPLLTPLFRRKNVPFPRLSSTEGKGAALEPFSTRRLTRKVEGLGPVHSFKSVARLRGAKFRQFRGSAPATAQKPRHPLLRHPTPKDAWKKSPLPRDQICSSPGTRSVRESVQGAQSPGPVTNAEPESSGSGHPGRDHRA